MPLPIQIPAQPALALCPSEIVAEGLLNPRGIHVQTDGSLLLAEAGSGQADQPFSGRISQLTPDPDRAGAYLPPQVLVPGFRSMNMQARMHRDEIMGLSDIACAAGVCLASQTDYVEGSRLLDLQYDPPEPVFYSKGNLNSLCHHPKRQSWMVVNPDTNLLVEFTAEHGEQLLAQLPDLAQGQEAVPVTLLHEPDTDAVLISLFSGELHSHPDRKGIDFADKAGQVIRLHPSTGQIETLITGLQLPTGLALLPDGRLLVLELCDRLLQPLPPDWAGEPRHGGFARFSGRLLCCNLQTAEVLVLAVGLDTPSNLTLLQNAVLISEGMGLTGRLLPTAEGGTVPLTGKIRRVQL